MHGEPKLLELVGAGGTAGRFSCLLDRRKKQANENANDGDYDEKLDERKRVRFS